MFSLASLFSANTFGVSTKLSMSFCVTCLMMHAGIVVNIDVSTRLTIRGRSMGIGEEGLWGLMAFPFPHPFTVGIYLAICRRLK